MCSLGASGACVGVGLCWLRRYCWLQVLAESQAEARALREQLERTKLDLQMMRADKSGFVPLAGEQPGSSRGDSLMGDVIGLPQPPAWATPYASGC